MTASEAIIRYGIKSDAIGVLGNHLSAVHCSLADEGYGKRHAECCSDKDGYRLPRMLSITGYVADSPIPTSTMPTAARAKPGENIRKQKPMAVSVRL